MKDIKICVVGLGYVGLPLAALFSKVFPAIGFDIKKQRIDQLKEFNDVMNEVPSQELKRLKFTSDPKMISTANFIVVTVPTPINGDKSPDLSLVKNASEIVGQNLERGSIVVYESTVYPGLTEEVCIPILEKESGLKCIKDFKVGYSSERVNPGDKQHTIDKIVKVIAGIDEETLKTIDSVYSKIVKAGVFKVRNIKTAEAAKVIENIQRDLNIALMNELSIIFSKMGINTKEVIEAAGTKWNFHKYYPGLVGGHCIGIDPYYLTSKAVQIGYEPKLILAGRDINEGMVDCVIGTIQEKIKDLGKTIKNINILVMGVTFKENVSDVRNSKPAELINKLSKICAEVHYYDPLIDKIDLKGRKCENIGELDNIDCIITASPHREFGKISIKDLLAVTNSNPILFDVKGFYKRDEAISHGFVYLTL